MRIEVLDHGYVELIECFGHGKAGTSITKQATGEEDFEVGIIEAARQSTQGAFRGWEKDDKLLRTLALSNPPHSTPFEFAGMVIEVQAPIMVYREWHRHRTFSVNEMSARYAPLPDLYYQPEVSDVLARAQRAQETKNKQLGAAVKVEIDPDAIAAWLRTGADIQKDLERFYQLGLAIGIPKEVARYMMPVCHYSRMRAFGLLRNWLAFLTLRTGEGVMAEMRRYALAVEQIIGEVFPHTYALWRERQGIAGDCDSRTAAKAL
jgi:thymidylate synthase (FAD)